MTARAGARGALAVCALLPLSAWAVEEDQSQPQGQTQPQSQDQGQAQTPTPGQSYVLGQTQEKLPPNHTEIYLTGGIGETDNVGLSETDRVAQTMLDVGTLVDVARQGPVLNGTLKGELDYLYYVEHAYPGQFVGRLDGDGSFTLVEDHIRWVVADQYGNAQVDALAAPNRDNIQSVNNFSTGPDFLWRPGETIYLRLGGRYQASDYQTSPYNSQRLVGTASVGEDLSLASSISLNADITSVRFQDPTTLNPDYDRRKFYLRFDTRGVRTTLALDLGTAAANDTGPYKSAFLGQLQLTRELSPFQSISISGGQQLTDSADAFSGLTGGAAGYPIIAPATGSGGNYLEDYVNGSWQFQRSRTAIAVTARWERDDYTIQPTPEQIQEYIALGIPTPLNVTRGTIAASLKRDLTPTLSAEVHGSYTHEDYTTLGYVDHSLACGAQLSLKPNRKLEYRLRYDYQARTTDTVPAGAPPGSGEGYTQNMIFLTVAYRLSE